MKKKKSLKCKMLIVILGLLLIAAVGFLAYSVLPRRASVDKTASVATFEFDASKATGWFAGANISGDAASTSASGQKTATATRIIAQGTAEKPTGDCFIQLSYWANNSKDLTQALNELIASPVDGSSTLVPTNTLDLSMLTASGDAAFQLHQYNLTGPDAAQLSDGEEFGFLKAGTGYIDIRGYCKTADELAVTLPVFTAISFKQ